MKLPLSIIYDHQFHRPLAFGGVGVDGPKSGDSLDAKPFVQLADEGRVRVVQQHQRSPFVRLPQAGGQALLLLPPEALSYTESVS